MLIKIAGRQLDLRIVAGAAVALVVVGVLLALGLSRRPADNRREEPVETIGDLYDWVTVDLLHVLDRPGRGGGLPVHRALE